MTHPHLIPARRWFLARYLCPPRLWIAPSLVFGVLGGALGGAGLSGCSGDTTGPAIIPASQVLWSLALNQSALNMSLVAPSNTFQLTATPLTQAGTPVTGVSSTYFQATDSSITVDSTGYVTAHYVTPLTYVIVSASANGFGYIDTVFIQVTATPPASALKTFTMQPAPNDSAKRSFDFIKTSGALGVPYSWPVRATDMAGDTVCSATVDCPLLVRYASSDSTVATISNSGAGTFSGELNVLSVGKTVFYASTWAYGVAWRDSVVFTVGYLLNLTIPFSTGDINFAPGFNIPKRLAIGVGAVARFWNESPRKTDVTFVDPTGMDTVTAQWYVGYPIDSMPPDGSGNIAAFGGDTLTYDNTLNSCGIIEAFYLTCYATIADFRARRFLNPKAYRFYSHIFPADTFELDVVKEH